MSDAVLYMLRNIHQYIGNRPELGKFVQSRDGTQTAAFFGVNAKGAGGKLMTRLFIAARSADGSASGAVVFDESSHFATSEPGMMKALYGVWHPVGINAAAASAPPQAAHQIRPRGRERRCCRSARAKLGRRTGGCTELAARGQQCGLRSAHEQPERSVAVFQCAYGQHRPVQQDYTRLRP
jgi:hypothetical protein